MKNQRLGTIIFMLHVFSQTSICSAQLSEMQLAPSFDDAHSLSESLQKGWLDQKRDISTTENDTYACWNYWKALTSETKKSMLNSGGESIPLPATVGAQFGGYIEGRLGLAFEYLHVSQVD